MEDWFKKFDSMTREERMATVKLTGVRFLYGSIILEWQGIHGFGEYSVRMTDIVSAVDPDTCQEYVESCTLEGDSECMDTFDPNKTFLHHLLNQFAEQVSLKSERRADNFWRKRNGKEPIYLPGDSVIPEDQMWDY